MLRSKSRVRSTREARLHRIFAPALLVGLGLVAAHGYLSALDGLARVPMFVATARISTAPGDTGEAALTGSDGSKIIKRRFDQQLDLGEAEAASGETVLALSKLSEDDSPVRKTSRNKPSGKKSPRHNAGHSTAPGKHVTTYRTVCVRLCDGAYFPISYATTKEHFATDAAACTARCESPSRLYVYRADSVPEAMKDLDGNPYIKLSTAFAFRSNGAPQCSCRANPWDEASRERHRMYALEDMAAAGDPAAGEELSLRHAVINLRETAPAPELVALGRASGPDRQSGDVSGFAFGPPVVAPLDETTVRPPVPLRYAGKLQQLSVVLDATGSPVRRHVTKMEATKIEKPLNLTMIARVQDTVAQSAAPDILAAVASLETSRPINDDEAEPSGRSEKSAAHEATTVEEGARKPATSRKAGRRTGHSAEHARAHRDRRLNVVDGAPATALRTSQIDKFTAGHRRVARADVQPDWRELIFRPY